MTVFELIKELQKIPNQNLPVWINQNYLRIGRLLFIMIKEPEDD